MANKAVIKIRAKQFNQLETPVDLAALVRREPHKLSYLALHPKYYIYKIPKPKGGERLIEDPHTNLKKVQRVLNEHLQAAYCLIRPRCVYGFTQTYGKEEERTILGNARQHLGCSYLLNIDLKDFFHQVDTDWLVRILKYHFDSLNAETIDLLVRLLSFKGRLPMGAPTSPVLSNYASIEMDEGLLMYCEGSGLNYTRYADDLSFSSLHPIERMDFENICQFINHSGFRINEQKIKWYDNKMTKQITGICLAKDFLFLEPSYLGTLRKEINRYTAFLEVESRYHTGFSLKKLVQFEQELRGKLNFAQMVMPDDLSVGQMQ